LKLFTARKTVLILIPLILVSFALGAFGQAKKDKNDDIFHDLEIFAKIMEKVKSYYVDEVDTHELMQNAIHEMLLQLDPHSQYLEGLDYEDLMVSTRGEFGGLGIFISFRDNYPTVISPIDDTPADKAGIRGGDQITEIEGMSTKGWRIDKAVGYLRGEPGSKVNFKISRPGQTDAIDYVIAREVINVKSVPYHGMFEGNTGYVKVSNFAKHTADELEAALNELEGEGMQRLVIDLRSNPGGLLQAATELSEMFLEKDKLLVYTKGRLPNSNRKFYSSNRSVHGGYPIVVMINGASASASEILAGALQDWDAALVVGQTSFGKGTVQTVFTLSETEAVKLTTAKYYTPSGRSIHKDHPKDSEVGTAIVTDGGSEEEMIPIETSTDPVDGEEGTPVAEKPEDDLPIFYTSNGRVVYGGGGITPDVEFEPREYTDLQRRLERDALAFSYVVDYFTDKGKDAKFTLDQKFVDGFFKFIDSRDFEYKKEDLTDENLEYVRNMLAREAASYRLGRQEAYRVVTEADPEFRKVMGMMNEAATLEAMFRYAEQHKSIQKASIK